MELNGRVVSLPATFFIFDTYVLCIGAGKKQQKMRFRIAYKDTVRAYLYNSKGKLLTTIYDSGFTKIKQVEYSLLKKVPFYSGKRLEVSILNEDKGTHKRYEIAVNN